mmetsp:Transcript_33413/g.34049  ORF Transcript_33413/g.34049 Transcript_33413/m.34049 type:complete len:92 (+) Transcript_33413:89-364(+)
MTSLDILRTSSVFFLCLFSPILYRTIPLKAFHALDAGVDIVEDPFEGILFFSLHVGLDNIELLLLSRRNTEVMSLLDFLMLYNTFVDEFLS